MGLVSPFAKSKDSLTLAEIPYFHYEPKKLLFFIAALQTSQIP